MPLSSALVDLMGIWDSIVYFGLTGLITVITIVLVAWIILKILRGMLQRSLKTAKIPENVSKLCIVMVSFVYWYFVAIAVLNALGLQQLALALGAILAFLGLAGGLAMSGVLKDMVSGVYLVTDRDFGVNFLIRAGNVQGRVANIDIRKTRIVDGEGKLHVIPNSIIESNEWIVYERPAETEES